MTYTSSGRRAVGKREAARGVIDALKTTSDGVPVAVLADGTTLAIVYDKARPMPAVRANEVDTLHRDPYLRDLLAPCRNMEQRQSVLLPLAKQGYIVSTINSRACTRHGKIDCWMCEPTPSVTPEPEPVASEPEPEPVAEPVALSAEPIDLSEYAKVVDLVAVERSMGEVIRDLAEQIAKQAPTVIQIAGREPVTLPAGALVHEATKAVIEDMEDGMHVYLTGAPGVGKSRMAATIAKSFGFADEDIHFFSCSNMDQKNSLLGFIRPTDGVFVPGPIYWAWKCKFVFIDEMDAGTGSALVAVNAGLDSPYLTFPNGETLQRPEQLFILAAGNTLGKGGDMMFMRNQMDAATRNRWVFHHVDYDRNIERQVVEPILGERTNAYLRHVWQVRENLEGERVVFSTRNIVAGAKMLRRGRDIETIVERALLPGESADIVRKSGALAFRG